MRFNPAVLSVMVLLAAGGCASDKPSATKSSPDSANHVKSLVIKDTKEGTGPGAELGDELWVVYTGKFMNGTVFDSNDKADADPFHLTLGSGDVIQGWAKGLVGMKAGGTRQLTIPYSLAYGPQGSQGKIPPYADLQFTIQLKQILKAKDAQTINANDVKKGTGPAAKKGDQVTVDYVASANGKEFETQNDISFTIGAEQMKIPSFDLALVGMQVGGVRDLVIPPALTRSAGIMDLGMNVGTYKVTMKKIEPGHGTQ